MMDEIDEILDKAPFYIEQVGIRQVREKVYYSESAINSPKAAPMMRPVNRYSGGRFFCFPAIC